MKTTVESEILEVLCTVVGVSKELVPLHAPEFGQGERALVMDCIDSSFVSSVGKYVNQFEAMLAEFTGARCAVAVVNGTAALEVALNAAGVRTGDEVIVPALSFVATANAVAHCGAISHCRWSGPSTWTQNSVSRSPSFCDWSQGHPTDARPRKVASLFYHPSAAGLHCRLSHRLELSMSIGKRDVCGV
jgi:hypothetical protein